MAINLSGVKFDDELEEEEKDPLVADLITDSVGDKPPAIDTSGIKFDEPEDKTFYLEDVDKTVSVPGSADIDQANELIQTQVYGDKKEEYVGSVKVSGWNLLKGVGRMIAELPQVAGVGIQESGELGELKAQRRIALLTDQLIRRREIETKMKENDPNLGFFKEFIEDYKLFKELNKLPRESFLTDIELKQQEAKVQIGGEFADVGREINRSNIEWVKNHGLTPDPGIINKVLFDVGGVGGSVLFSVGLSALMKNNFVTPIVFGAIQKAQIFQEAEGKGIGIERRKEISDRAGAMEALIEFIGLEIFFKYMRGAKTIQRTLVRTGSNGLQEVGQQGSEEFIRKTEGLSNDSWADMFLRIGYSGILGLVGGFPTSAIFTVMENKGVVGDLRRAGFNDVEIGTIVTAVGDSQKEPIKQEVKKMLEREAEKQATETQPEVKATVENLEKVTDDSEVPPEDLDPAGLPEIPIFENAKQAKEFGRSENPLTSKALALVQARLGNTIIQLRQENRVDEAKQLEKNELKFVTIALAEAEKQDLKRRIELDKQKQQGDLFDQEQKEEAEQEEQIAGILPGTPTERIAQVKDISKATGQSVKEVQEIIDDLSDSFITDVGDLSPDQKLVVDEISRIREISVEDILDPPEAAPVEIKVEDIEESQKREIAKQALSFLNSLEREGGQLVRDEEGKVINRTTGSVPDFVDEIGEDTMINVLNKFIDGDKLTDKQQETLDQTILAFAGIPLGELSQEESEEKGIPTFAEWSETPESTQVPAGSILTVQPDEITQEFLEGKTNSELEALSIVLGIPKAGTKKFKVDRILAVQRVKEQVDDLGIDGLQQLSGKELKSLLKSVNQKASGNKNTMAFDLFSWVEQIRRNGRIDLQRETYNTFLSKQGDASIRARLEIFLSDFANSDKIFQEERTKREKRRRLLDDTKEEEIAKVFKKELKTMGVKFVGEKGSITEGQPLTIIDIIPSREIHQGMRVSVIDITKDKPKVIRQGVVTSVLVVAGQNKIQVTDNNGKGIWHTAEMIARPTGDIPNMTIELTDPGIDIFVTISGKPTEKEIKQIVKVANDNKVGIDIMIVNSEDENIFEDNVPNTKGMNLDFRAIINDEFVDVSEAGGQSQEGGFESDKDPVKPDPLHIAQKLEPISLVRIQANSTAQTASGNFNKLEETAKDKEFDDLSKGDIKAGLSKDGELLISGELNYSKAEIFDGLVFGDKVKTVGINAKSGKGTSAHRKITWDDFVTYEGVVEFEGIDYMAFSYQTDNLKMNIMFKFTTAHGELFLVDEKTLSIGVYKAFFELSDGTTIDGRTDKEKADNPAKNQKKKKVVEENLVELEEVEERAPTGDEIPFIELKGKPKVGDKVTHLAKQGRIIAEVTKITAGGLTVDLKSDAGTFSFVNIGNLGEVPQGKDIDVEDIAITDESKVEKSVLAFKVLRIFGKNREVIKVMSTQQMQDTYGVGMGELFFADPEAILNVFKEDFPDAVAWEVSPELIKSQGEQDSADEILEKLSPSEEIEKNLEEIGIEANETGALPPITPPTQEAGGAETPPTPPPTTEAAGDQEGEPEPKPTIALDEFIRNRSKRPITAKVIDLGADLLEDLVRQSEDFLGVLSTRVGNISPDLKRRLRRFDFQLLAAIRTDTRGVVTYLKGINKIPKNDRSDLDLALKNGDIATIKRIDRENGLEEAHERVRETLKGLYARADAAGIEVRYLEGFWPRVIKNPKKLLEKLHGSRAWSQISAALQEKETELGRVLEDDEKAYLVNSLLRGFNVAQIRLSKPNALKERRIDVVTADLNVFYADSEAALISYITTVNEAIEANKFFGKGKLDKSEKLTPEERRELSDSEKARLKQKKIDLKFANIKDSIGVFVMEEVSKGNINAADEAELSKLLDARFIRGRISFFVGFLKDTSYITILGNPINALTQLGDLAFSVYKSGVWRTTKSFFNAATKQSAITKESIGIDRVAAEFTSGARRSEKAVRLAFKFSGLSFLDNVGKETTINAVIDKYRKIAKKPTPAFLEMMDRVLGDEAAQTIKDLKEGAITENVKFLAFNELADVQPISLSEVPVNYLKAKNGKILYALKTYQIKLLDVFRNESFAKMNTDPVEGITNFLRLIFALVSVNASADMIKNFVMGRPFDVSDLLANNILKIMGFNRYTIYRVKADGPARVLAEQILPPTQILDNIYKDSETAFRIGSTLTFQDVPELLLKARSVQNIPLGGKLFYWWVGRGRELSAKERERLENKEAEIRFLKSLTPDRRKKFLKIEKKQEQQRVLDKALGRQGDE